MQEQDSWQERYLSVVPEKLTAADVRVLLGLIEEDPQRFLEALEAFVAASKDKLEDADRDA